MNSFRVPAAFGDSILAAETKNWLVDLFTSNATHGTIAVAHAVLVLALVVACGVALGRIKIGGISLGIGGVLFSGIAFAHFGITIGSPEVLHFVREFGLILFVFTIGLQVGPGMLASLRKAGLPLNLMAASIVLLGAAVTLGIVYGAKAMGKPIPMPVAVGLLAGATTNTPSLAAAQEALRGQASHAPPATAASQPGTTGGEDPSKSAAVGYALGYPFGILGIIVSMLVIRAMFNVNIKKENDLFAKLNVKGSELETENLEISNPNLEGMTLSALQKVISGGVVISRIVHDGVATVPSMKTYLHVGDVLHLVGTREQLDRARPLIGMLASLDAKTAPGDIAVARLVVTQREVLGKTLAEIGVEKRFGATITRTSRAEVVIAATPGWRLQFGDVLTAVGSPEGLKQLGKFVGNSVKELDHPHLIPVFMGIALGVIVGSIPISIPGIPAPVKLGLAGGPLLVAIVLSRVGQIGKLSWYMPRSANLALREFGIVLFLACVGLIAGEGLVKQLVSGDGLYWMAMASLITILPLMIVGLIARAVLKVNFVSICGLLSGAMTDPPALAFANQISGGEAPSVAYSTVYPLTMLLRVVTAQAIVLIFWSP